MSDPVCRAWSLLTLTDQVRSFFGNDGYDDRTGRSYRYDSRVANSRHVSEGDLAMIRDNRSILGFGVISEIELTMGNKVVRTCPSCGSSKIGKRKLKLPEYRCQLCHEECDYPKEQAVPVALFTANYGTSWTPLNHPLSVASVSHCYLSKAAQHAIRELSMTELLSEPSVSPLVKGLCRLS